MAFTEKELGQSRPANTTAVSIYSPGASTITIIKTIIVCNTSGAAATFRIFLDNDGTTYDQTTALFYDRVCDIDASVVIHPFAIMDDSSGNLAVRASVGNALTFTAYGAEVA